MTLFFLSSNGVAFTKPCDDPWYAAHRSKVEDASGPTQDGPAGVLGCVERYQFCNPDSKMGGDSCTPFTGIYTATAAAEALWRTNKQREFFNISSDSILKDAGDLHDIVMYMGISSLIARRGLTRGFQGSLPNNQWQLEVENWFTTTLADLQRVTVEYATGPTDPAVFPLLKRAQTDQEQLMCRSLVSHHSSLSSFPISKQIHFSFRFEIPTNISRAHLENPKRRSHILQHPRARYPVRFRRAHHSFFTNHCATRPPNRQMVRQR